MLPVRPVNGNKSSELNNENDKEMRIDLIIVAMKLRDKIE